MNIRDAIGHIVQGRDLCFADMQTSMQQLMTGQATDAQVAAFLTGLRMKGECVDEIAGAAAVMRAMASGVNIKVNTDHLVDIVGTGGDGARLFNVSTAAAFVAAAAGASVAKHGNRGVSSRSGSADLLSQSGVNLNLSAQQVSACVEQLGIGFLFAPHHHKAMRHTARLRQELGFRTFMNILGPLTNPAAVPNLVIGVFDGALCRPLAEVLKRLDSQRALVVHALDGLDELSLATGTRVAELRDNRITEYQINPEELGLKRQELDGLTVQDPSESLQLIYDALENKQTARARKAADMIALNAGAALYVTGLAQDMSAGVSLALDTIRQGGARQKMKALARFTCAFQENQRSEGAA
ncbi:MAG: anthranilate phosphoribosyltransferase [Kistimonas sp.]|nr:anthranilate phosphoribosyltransferase [Kistimonas sp.]